MPYLSESALRAARLRFSSLAEARLKSSKSAARISIFLSHSHKDKELAEGLIKELAEQGVELYVDWRDTEMPAQPNSETAAKLKERIQSSDLFFLLATVNATNSRWVPWEVGVGDQAMGQDKVLIVPVKDSAGSFGGSEYLQLYKHVERRDGRLEVFDPGRVSGTTARSFLESKVVRRY